MLCKKHLLCVMGFALTGKAISGRSQVLGERRSFLIQEKKERRETTQYNISREKGASWVFPELAESNRPEKRKIWNVFVFSDGLTGCLQVGSFAFLSITRGADFLSSSKSQTPKEVVHRGRTSTGDDFNHEGNFSVLVVCSQKEVKNDKFTSGFQVPQNAGFSEYIWWVVFFFIQYLQLLEKHNKECCFQEPQSTSKLCRWDH